MTLSTHKQKFLSKKSRFWGYSAYNLYDMYVSLCRYDFVVKVDVGKSKLVWSRKTDVTCPRKT